MPGEQIQIGEAFLKFSIDIKDLQKNIAAGQAKGGIGRASGRGRG